MELAEPVETINRRLIEHFGVDTITGQPIWRIVWSDDQYEHRYGTYDDITPAGLYLRTVTEVRYVPKYRQWIHQKFILERLVLIPEVSMPELPATKMSYENIWTFEDRNGNYLPPKWEAAKFVIDTIYAVQYGNHDLARYADPDNGKGTEEIIDDHKKKVDGLVEELFGDESGLMGTTFDESSSTIFVPHNYKKVN